MRYAHGCSSVAEGNTPFGGTPTDILCVLPLHFTHTSSASLVVSKGVGGADGSDHLT